jgi:hypothetical protein
MLSSTWEGMILIRRGSTYPLHLNINIGLVHIKEYDDHGGASGKPCHGLGVVVSPVA